MPSTKNVVLDNLKLITSEYQNSPKYIEYCKTFLDMLYGTFDVLWKFDDVFDIDSAVGDQLDKLGVLVGANGRYIPEEDIGELNDDYYRYLVKFKIYQNHWDGTTKQWLEIMKLVFPSSAFDIIDNQDMTVSVTVIDPSFDEVLLTLLLNGYLLPKPSGVKVNYMILERPLFGWDSDTQFIKGWNDGQWQ